MTFDLSQNVKILILGGLALLIAAAGGVFFLLEGNQTKNSPVTTSVSSVHSHPTTHHKAAVPHPSAPVKLTAGLPAPVHAALLHSKTVVAVVYTPGDPLDNSVLLDALVGAKIAKVKVVVLNVTNDTIAGVTATWMKSVVDPAVLVVNRPGTIAAELNGFSDAAAIAQAVADARR